MQTMANIIDEESKMCSELVQKEQGEHPVAWTKEQADNWRQGLKPKSPWLLVAVQIVVAGALSVLT